MKTDMKKDRAKLFAYATVVKNYLNMVQVWVLIQILK